MNLHLAHYYRVQALFRELGCPQKRGSLFCKPLRGQSLPGPSPPCSLGRAPPIPQAVPSCLPPPPIPARAAHHGLLEFIGLDAAHEEGLAGTQRPHQQLQRPLKLAAECGRALPGLGALGGWTTAMGGADSRPSGPPEGKQERRSAVRA